MTKIPCLPGFIRAEFCRMKCLLASVIAFGLLAFSAQSAERPNIILVMADDMGWGETSYNNHPVLKTPNLDAMAASGLRFDRFYAGAPVCSPTRASVLTGRSNDRGGVLSHGYALRLQEKTIVQALRKAGYVTGHFGKWHLNGFSGPGAPILSTDPRHPGVFGFDEWVSVSNFYDVDPLLSRSGKIEEFKGDSSEIAVDEALKFIEKHKSGKKPVFVVIWFGTPHSPFRALEKDKAAFASLSEESQNHYGELVALDRSVGTLRKGLRDFGVADNTLLVFCSDNGGLPEIKPDTVNGLRGFKASVFEGGLRVPGIIEWPAVIKTPRITQYPASTMDIFPTVADIVKLPASSMLKPIDGESLRPLFTKDVAQRKKPIPFRYRGAAALVNNNYKLLTQNISTGVFQLYDLQSDPRETRDLSKEFPKVAQQMRADLLAWIDSVEASAVGKDYPEGKVTPADPEPRFWANAPEYQSYLPEWEKRPEYNGVVERARKAASRKK